MLDEAPTLSRSGSRDDAGRRLFSECVRRYLKKISGLLEVKGFHNTLAGVVI